MTDQLIAAVAGAGPVALVLACVIVRQDKRIKALERTVSRERRRVYKLYNAIAGGALPNGDQEDDDDHADA